MLVFEEDDRIVGADGRAQKAAGIERGRRHDHAQAGNVGEKHFAGLAVIDAAAGQIAADGHANHHRRLENSGAAPARQRQLVANLHHGRPDVVEKLYLHDRLHSAHGHADGAADDVGFGQRRIEDARRAESPLQSPGGFEYAALALHVGQVLLAAAIGHVLAENHDARVALQFIGQRGGHHLDHGLDLAGKSRLGFKRARARIDVGRVHPAQNGIFRRRLGRQGAVGGRDDFLVGGSFQRLQLFFVDNALAHQKQTKARDGIALRVGFQLRGGAIKLLVVGKRM